MRKRSDTRSRSDGIALAWVACISALLILLSLAITFTSGMMLSNAERKLREERCYELARTYAMMLDAQLQVSGKESYTSTVSNNSVNNRTLTRTGGTPFYWFAYDFVVGGSGRKEEYYEDTPYYFKEQGFGSEEYGTIKVELSREYRFKDVPLGVEQSDGTWKLPDGRIATKPIYMGEYMNALRTVPNDSKEVEGGGSIDRIGELGEKDSPLRIYDVVHDTWKQYEYMKDQEDSIWGVEGAPVMEGIFRAIGQSVSQDYRTTHASISGNWPAALKGDLPVRYNLVMTVTATYRDVSWKYEMEYECKEKIEDGTPGIFYFSDQGQKQIMGTKVYHPEEDFDLLVSTVDPTGKDMAVTRTATDSGTLKSMFGLKDEPVLVHKTEYGLELATGTDNLKIGAMHDAVTLAPITFVAQVYPKGEVSAGQIMKNAAGRWMVWQVGKVDSGNIVVHVDGSNFEGIASNNKNECRLKEGDDLFFAWPLYSSGIEYDQSIAERLDGKADGVNALKSEVQISREFKPAYEYARRP